MKRLNFYQKKNKLIMTNPRVYVKEGDHFTPNKFSIPFLIRDECPHCMTIKLIDLEQDCYAIMEKRWDSPMAVPFYCSYCDYNWEIYIRVNIEVRVDYGYEI